MTSHSWDPIDDFFGNDETDSATHSTNNQNNEDELDQNELLGINEEHDNFDDDFGLDDQKSSEEIHNQVPIYKTDETEQQIKTENKEPVSSINSQEVSNVIKDNQQIASDDSKNKVDAQLEEELQNFKCDDNLDLKYEELDYDDFLDYGEVDDLELSIKKTSNQDSVHEQNVIESKKIDEQNEKPVSPIKITEIKLDTKDSLNTLPVETKIKKEENNGTEAINESEQKIAENLNSGHVLKKNQNGKDEDEQDEEEDEDGTKKKRGRSNHWSERNDSNANDSETASTSYQNKNYNSNNKNYRNNHQRQNNRNNNSNNNNNRANYQKSQTNFMNHNNNNNSNKQGLINNPHSHQQIMPSINSSLLGNPDLATLRNPIMSNDSAPLMSLNINNSHPTGPINQNSMINQSNIPYVQNNYNNNQLTPPKNNWGSPLMPGYNTNNMPPNQNIPLIPNPMVQQSPPFMSKQNFNPSHQQIPPPLSMNNRPEIYQNMPFQNDFNRPGMNKLSPNNFINPRTDISMTIQQRQITQGTGYNSVNNQPGNQLNFNQTPPGYQNMKNIQNGSVFNKPGLLPTPPQNVFQTYNNINNNNGNFNSGHNLVQSTNLGRQSMSSPFSPNKQYNINMNPNQGLSKNPLMSPEIKKFNSIPVQSQIPAQAKPSTVYINPSFISKQKQKEENSNNLKSSVDKRNCQNVLKENSNHQDSKQHSEKLSKKFGDQMTKHSSSGSLAKNRSIKDLEALLDARLADVEMEDEHSKSRSNASTSNAIKRKSCENGHNKDSSKHCKRSIPANNRRSDESHSKLGPKADEVSEKKISSKVASVVKPVKNSASLIKSAPEPTIIIDDPDYAKKMEEQKKKREQILKMKEEKRNQRIKGYQSKVEFKSVKSLEKSKDQSPPTENKRNIIISSKVSPISTQKPKRVVTTSTKSLITTNSVKQLINKTILDNNNEQKQRIQNITASTSEKNNSINLKDKVKYKIID